MRRAQTKLASTELSREEKFRGLLNAALATRYYSDRARTDLLLEAQDLGQIPVTPLRDLLNRPEAFSNRNSPRRRHTFQPPFKSDNLVVCGMKLALPRGAREIGELSLAQLNLSQTRMLVATPPLLRRICAAVEAQALALPQLSEAVVVLGSNRDGMLLPGERDMLWRCFGVPVFEQWLGLDGELLAWECEAHQGLHVDADKVELEVIAGELVVTSWLGRSVPALRLATGWHGEIQTGPCSCGHSGPILAALETLHPLENSRAMAASTV